MAKGNKFDWAGLTGTVLKTLGKWLLKVCAFIGWIIVCIVFVMFRETKDALHNYLFKKEKF